MSVFYLGFQYLWKENQQMLSHSVPAFHILAAGPLLQAAMATDAEHARLQWELLLQSSAQKELSRTGNLGWCNPCLHFMTGGTGTVSWYLLQAMLEHSQWTKVRLCLNGLILRECHIHLPWAQKWKGRQERGWRTESFCGEPAIGNVILSVSCYFILWKPQEPGF